MFVYGGMWEFNWKREYDGIVWKDGSKQIVILLSQQRQLISHELHSELPDSKNCYGTGLYSDTLCGMMPYHSHMVSNKINQIIQSWPKSEPQIILMGWIWIWISFWFIWLTWGHAYDLLVAPIWQSGVDCPVPSYHNFLLHQNSFAKCVPTSPHRVNSATSSERESFFEIQQFFFFE